MSSPIRLAILGTGRMGRIRAQHIFASPRFEISAVVDVNLAAAEKLAKEFRVANFGTSLEGVEYDGLVVSTPTFTHLSAIEGSKDNTPIFLEKPIAEDAEGIRKAFEIARRKGNTLCCGFQRRFDDTYVAGSTKVKNGEIGKVVNCNVIFGDHPCPSIEFLKEGGDIFMDLAPHDVDYVLNTLDDKVKSVYATGCSSDPILKEAGVIDNATVLCETVKGSVITLTMSRSAEFGYDQRCEFFGVKGSVSVGNVKKHEATISNAEGITTSVLAHSFPQRFAQGFAAELDGFADVLEGKKEWPVSEEDCVHVQNVAGAAGISFKEGRKVNVL
ncbi:hypothetical protein TL16_g04326 [Triparma laevis f. inornata]|uniref:Uncharacterized protein n=2 Tax=Triparma laevis TaxID=1534972 RepID=A0A9W7F6J5_9STRA|nr:hypothetical protein TL16_g04326 [Triparma laevis f. inornata]GMI02659.1 hypothetical protein TrLO_g11493 [Triparma laevis f. longispina]